MLAMVVQGRDEMTMAGPIRAYITIQTLTVEIACLFLPMTTGTTYALDLWSSPWLFARAPYSMTASKNAQPDAASRDKIALLSHPHTKILAPTHNPATNSSGCPAIATLTHALLPSIIRTTFPRTSRTMNGEDPPERPEYVSTIINGLERYNPEAVSHLEGYLQEQCEQKFCDCNANRTLLKL